MMNRALPAAGLGLLLLVCTDCGQEQEDPLRGREPEGPLPPPIRKAVAQKFGKVPENVTAADLARVEALNLDDRDVRDADLVHLKRLPQLQSLSLWTTDVTDAGLAHLQELPQLKCSSSAARR
jgi:hypothetical protein